MIPRIVHQIWLGESGGPHPPPRFVETARTWRDRNPAWEYRLWSGDEVTALFEEQRPDLLGLYRGYPYWVQRADAARYLILHHVGGVYADMDITCARPLDELTEHDAVLAPTEPAGVSNDLMMSRPGHPLFAELLDALPTAYRRWNRPWVPRHFRIMCGTGSLFLTGGLRRHGGRSQVRLLTAAEYGHGGPQRAFVRHLEGNTWAGWDTHALLFLGRHWKALVAAAAIAAAAWWLTR